MLASTKQNVRVLSSCPNESHRILEDGSRVPTQEYAVIQYRKFRECSNELLYVLAVQGEYGARKERLVREIMRIDNVDWLTARVKVDTEINSQNDRFGFLVRLPYRIGVTVGLIAAITAVPLVFHLPTAAWFCHYFVHESPPDEGLESLDTIWKVGNWTWGWMEPYLGTASFVLLGLQFTRVNMQRLNLKPYNEAILSWRAQRLAKHFPQYDQNIVREFSKSDPWHH